MRWKYSTACSADAIRHLMRACNSTAVCYDQKHENTIITALESSERETESSSSTRYTNITIPWTSVGDIRQLEDETQRTALSDASKRSQSADDVVLYGHSSGTSTGLPKPIPITNRGEIGALPQFHQTALDPRPPSTFTTTPIYTGGLADLWRSWSAAATLWTYPEDRAPVTGENVHRFIKAAKEWRSQRDNAERSAAIGYLSCVPFVVQMMSEDGNQLTWLRQMDMVGVGGAAMPAELGDKLVSHEINLVSRFGSRECGFLLSSHRDYPNDKEWQYLRKHEDVNSFYFKEWSDNKSELIVSGLWPSLSPAVTEKLPFNSHDIFTSHPTMPNAWQYGGRSDVQITLLTGKKFDPSGIESALCTSEYIQDAVIVGDDREYPAALIFLSGLGEKLTEHERTDKIWSEVQKVNASCPSHARIQRDSIKILPAQRASEIKKSSKRTVMRGKFAEAFKTEMQDLYQNQPVDFNGGPLDEEDLDKRVKTISSIIQYQLGRELPSVESNFYDQGVDSMSCMQIRNQIKARLSPEARKLLPLNIMYEAGNTRRLAEVVGQLGSEGAVGRREDNRIVDRDAMARTVDEFVSQQLERFCCLSEALSSSTETPTNTLSGRVVLLTGATGFLGAHILSELLQDDAIHKVVLPVRLSKKSSHLDSESTLARARVDQALKTYGLPLPRQSSPCIECFAADLELPALGLTEQKFEDLVLQVSDIIHGAWAVNFNLPFDRFKGQFDSLTNLFDTAALANSTRRPRQSNGSAIFNEPGISFIFLSSTASIASSPQRPIRETISSEPKDASETGYGQSKWVAEAILERLASALSPAQSPRIRILRVGQLTGSTRTGIWNMREAWPLMFDAGLRSLGGIIPDLVGDAGLGRLDWLPVDLAARAVTEIAFSAMNDESGNRAESLVKHVLNCEERSIKWEDVQRWLQKFVVKKASETTRIVPVSEWLDALENLEEDHPAKSLLELWRRGWVKNLNVGTDDLEFRIERAEALSPTIRAGGIGMSISQHKFENMLQRILDRASKRF